MTVTLVTGDQVTMRDDMVLSIRPGEGREKVTFSQFSSGEHIYVMPNDARQLVTTGQLDRRLFDLTTLIDFGYDDAHRDTVPLIVTHPKGQAAPRVAGAAVSRELPSINAVALAADKSAAAWDALTDGGALRTASVSKIWLDGKRQSTLDYSVPQIGAPTAWEAGLTGAGVKVAVLDTGVDQTHPDLAGQEIAEQNFSWSPDNVDNRGHGTHVASILAGTGAKYRGVAPGASILDGKVLDDFGGGSESGIVAGMEWAAQQGADIANMSLAGMNTPEIDPLEQAIESLTAQYGTLFVVAAGNRNVFLSEITSPGSAPSALTVGAVDRNDALANFSLTGPTVGDNAIKPDITAPGVGIVAALHSAGTIGTPVEDGYTALSGTSMATPHVAGAAALIAQQHPDWTGQQLKAALTGSAKPTQGLTEFQQGAGRVDVTRALHQTVVAEPANLNLGTVAWPHDDDEPVAKPVTYRNLGDTDVTLDLTVDGPVFSLSTNQITVPAGGTASANIIGDAKAARADGVYSATVVAASSNDSVTRTPVAITRETEKYNLTLNYVDEHGQPTSRYSPTVTSLEDASETIPYDPDGSVTVRLPKGRYVIDSVVHTGPDDHQNMIVQPGVNLDRDQTFTIDPTIAKPISITLPTTAELGQATIGYMVETEDDRAAGGIWANDLSTVSTAQLGEPLPGTETSYWVNSNWRSEAEEHFELFWLLDRYPTGYTKTVRWRELATIRMELGAGIEGDKGVPLLIAESLSNPDVSVGAGPEVDIPTTHVAYVTTEGIRWRTEMWLTVDYFSVADLKGPWRNYRAGRTYREQYNRPMYGPGLPSGNSPWGLPWAWRKDDRIAMNVPLFTDSAGNAGFTWAESGSTKLYLDDQLVGEWPSPGSGDFRDLPAAQGNYRVTTEAVNPERFAPTAAVSVEWTFRSGQVDTVTALDLNVVRFHPKLTEDGSAPAGKQFQIPVQVQDETGATVRPRQLTVEASYDEGKTWQRVPLTSNQVAKLNHPAGATSVSLRACATDRGGNTVKQTIISAYTLR